MILLTLEQVVVLHEHQIERFGGMPGVNDLGLVESAVNAVANRIYYENCQDPTYIPHFADLISRDLTVFP